MRHARPYCPFWRQSQQERPIVGAAVQRARGSPVSVEEKIAASLFCHCLRRGRQQRVARMCSLHSLSLASLRRGLACGFPEPFHVVGRRWASQGGLLRLCRRANLWRSTGQKIDPVHSPDAL